MTIANIEEAIYSALAGNGILTALVLTRIYPLDVPQEAILPYVVFSKTGGIRHSAMGTDLSLMESRIEVEIWADSLKEARAVADAVRGVMQRWRGTYGGVVVQDSLITAEYDEYSSDDDAYQSVIDFQIFHT